MIARQGSGWQTVLADLSLILFMVSIGALTRTPPPQSGGTAFFEGAPMAVWRAGSSGQDLPHWLAVQQADPRARLTLVIHAAPDRAAAALAIAQAASGAAASGARFVIEPGPGPEIEAVLAYDRLPSARDLQVSTGMPPDKEPKQ
jgi:hypothetical protein